MTKVQQIGQHLARAYRQSFERCKSYLSLIEAEASQSEHVLASVAPETEEANFRFDISQDSTLSSVSLYSTRHAQRLLP